METRRCDAWLEIDDVDGYCVRELGHKSIHVLKEPDNEWMTSARKYITLTEECECDCFLCMRGEHDEHCDESSFMFGNDEDYTIPVRTGR